MFDIIANPDSSRHLRAITYGTFDLLHDGHVKLLTRVRRIAHWTALGLSTDAFNAEKNKVSHQTYEQRRHALIKSGLVDLIFPERTWEQKREDIARLRIDVFVMGDDWRGAFDDLATPLGAQVLYLPRTPGIDSTLLRNRLSRGSS
jgi:glycerol-3-phosphate cytidylyltransferase